MKTKTSLNRIEQALKKELFKAVKLSNKLGKGLNPMDYSFQTSSMTLLRQMAKEKKIRFHNYSLFGKNGKKRGYWIVK